MKDEEVRIWKETVVDYFKVVYYSGIFQETDWLLIRGFFNDAFLDGRW